MSDANTIATMIASCPVTMVDASTKCTELQVTRDGEPLDPVENYEPYGFTSYPLVGSEALVVNVDGASDYPVACVVQDRRYRPTDLAAGEVAVYNSSAKEVRITSSGVDITGAVTATSTVTATGRVAAAGFNIGAVTGKSATITDGAGLIYIFANGVLVGGTGAV